VKSLWTIGYEGRTVDELLARLKSNGVGFLVDVRALPLSHKRGFSKNALAKALEGVGIAYAHRPALGTPKSVRTRYKRDHDFGTLKAAFDEYLEDQTDSLLQLVELVRRRRTCLLCFEADPAVCHRSLVAAAVRRLGGPPAKHL
jgi:uncharacterized protein (DUF488 family)